MTLGWPFSLFEFDRSRLRDELARGSGGSGTASAGVFPAVNIYDDGESFLVRAEVPGVDKSSLEITARGEQLSIRGERVLPDPEAQASFHRREREGGQFRRTLTLPQRVDSSKVSASYRNGVLEVTLPRVSEAQARKIQIS
jgi:HSP20 family protein